MQVRVIRCADCGFEAHGVDEDSLADQVRTHARDAHGMALTHDEALLLAFHAQLGAPAHDPSADG